jgi:predicted signal transduction protein with EAL and GGDEF domain
MSALHVILGLIVAIQALMFGAASAVVAAGAEGDARHGIVQLAIVHGLALLLTLIAAWRIKVWVCRPGQVFLEQIRALGEWQFQLHPQPGIREWVPISRALNVVVERVKQHLHERERAVGDLRKQLNHDELTLATSRQHFMWLLESQLQTRHANGGVSIIRVHDLEGLNQRLGRQRTDELLVAVATTIRAHLLMHHDADDFVLARLNGADFGLLWPGADVDRLRTSLQGMALAIAQLADDGLSDVTPVAWMGGATYAHGETVSQVLARVDAMVMQSHDGRGQAAVATHDGSQTITAVAQWRHVIETALATGHLTLDFVDVLDMEAQLAHRHGSLQLILPDGTQLARHVFMPAALRCGRSAELDLKAVEIALEAATRMDGVIAVEVSRQSALSPMFGRRLLTLLTHRPELARRLVLELTDTPDTRTLVKAMEALDGVVAKTGCGMALRDFGVGQTALPLLAPRRLRHVQLSHLLREDRLVAAHQQAFVRLLARWGQDSSVRVLPGDGRYHEEAGALA